MSTGRTWQMVAAAGLILTSVWTGQTRADWLFGTPKNLGPQVNSSVNEYDPALSADGLELYFQSSRSGGSGDSDLYLTTRVSLQDEWQPAQNLGPTVNAVAAESGPSLSADGLTLYFNSNPSAERAGSYSESELLTCGPRFLGVPRRKSPRTCPAQADASVSPATATICHFLPMLTFTSLSGLR